MKSRLLRFGALLVVLSLGTFLSGCGTTTPAKTSQTSDNGAVVPTDYSQSSHWLSLPAKNDQAVDVFYLYPTAWAKAADSQSIVSTVDDPMMVQNAQLAFNRQATAFTPVANVYAPYYRQYDASATSNMSYDEQQDVVKGVPLTDAMAAFDYYIQHYNNGRPFILASHSQGSNVMIYLLSQYMNEHPDVYKRMVAAYVIGYSITDDYLSANPHLKFAEGAGDTGVIISYNTQAPTIEGTDFVVLPTAHVINPISWTLDETTAPASENMGSIAINSDGTVVTNADGSYQRVMNFADATVDIEKGALICSTVDVDTYAPGSPAFGKGVFHSYDYPFYYFNLQENAKLRITNYLEKNHLK
jgi:hypothetical protein